MATFKKWLAPFHLLTNVMNAVGTIGIFAVMLLIVSDVSMRTLFNKPLVGVPELVKIGIVTIVFMQAAHTLAVGRFTATGVFLGFVAGISPRAARTLEALFHLAGAALFYFVARGAYDQLLHNYATKEFIGSQGIFTIPVWPQHAAILFGAIVLALQFVICAIGFLTGQSPAPIPGHEESHDAEETAQ
jgi:C4-dicarboxylate transporter, DctM subunit